MASFALPAWAVHSVNLFADYSPASWVAAGFAGMFLATFCYWLWQVGLKVRVRAKYDYRLLGGPSPINPLDKTFEGKRVYLNEFTLPSHTVIEGKTFIDCEIIGPANLHWYAGNQATDNKGPVIDAVYLDPGRGFHNGFQLENCIFRGCSFQRITLFVGYYDYEGLKNHPLLNWISPTPDTGVQQTIDLNPDQPSTSDTQSLPGTESETQQ